MGGGSLSPLAGRGEGRLGERRDQHAGATADPLERHRSDRALAARAAGGAGFGPERLGAQRRDVGHIAEAGRRRWRCVDERAVGRKRGDRGLASGEQARRPFGQRQGGPDRLGRGDQDRRHAVGERKARARAGDRTADPGADAAQALEARRAPVRQGSGKAHHLGGERLGGRHPALGECVRAGGAEDRRACRVGPQHPRRVRAPQPDRRRAQRVVGEARVADMGQERIGEGHRLHRPRSAATK
jgi:hypothetical protein